MGGALKVVVRFSDGSVEADVRGTNSLPYWIRHPGLIRGDESHMRRYVDMTSDFKVGDSTYTPVEYGVFVVDHVTMTIISANRYSDGATLCLGSYGEMRESFGASDEDDGGQVFAEMLAEGALYLQSRPRHVANPFAVQSWLDELAKRPPFVPERIDLAGMPPASWDERVYEPYGRYSRTNGRKSEEERDAMPLWDLCVDFKEWTHVRLGNEIADQDELRARLRALGFPFDDKSEEAYANWVKEARSPSDAELG